MLAFALMVTLFNAFAFLNTPSANLVTPLRLIVASCPQFSNADTPMVLTPLVVFTSTLLRLLLPKNALSPIVRSAAVLLSAPSIVVKVASAVQFSNAELPIRAMKYGRVIVVKDVQSINAPSPIVVTRPAGSYAAGAGSVPPSVVSGVMNFAFATKFTVVRAVQPLNAYESSVPRFSGRLSVFKAVQPLKA